MSNDLNDQQSMNDNPAQTKKTVLLVDEDSKIAAVFHDFLQSEGYRMIQATTVSEALTYLEKEKVALIITDLRLSEYSGLSLLVRVRALLYPVPVIVMSAYTDFMSEEDWRLLGATEFIAKPPDLSQLREVISRVLERDNERRRT
ncbi:MAG: response regulator [bacterium]